MKNLFQYKIVFLYSFIFVQFNSQDIKIDDLNNETIEKRLTVYIITQIKHGK